MSVFLAGGGLKMGQVIGATNSQGRRARGPRAMDSNCLLATIYRRFGINPSSTLPDKLGRPIADSSRRRADSRAVLIAPFALHLAAADRDEVRATDFRPFRITEPSLQLRRTVLHVRDKCNCLLILSNRHGFFKVADL